MPQRRSVLPARASFSPGPTWATGKHLGIWGGKTSSEHERTLLTRFPKVVIWGAHKYCLDFRELSQRDVCDETSGCGHSNRIMEELNLRRLPCASQVSHSPTLNSQTQPRQENYNPLGVPLCEGPLPGKKELS